MRVLLADDVRPTATTAAAMVEFADLRTQKRKKKRIDNNPPADRFRLKVALLSMLVPRHTTFRGVQDSHSRSEIFPWSFETPIRDNV